MRFSTAALSVLLLLALPGASGAEAPASPSGETGDAPFFPIHSLLGAFHSPEIPWRPDWPLDIPPDGFTLRQKQAPAAITLSLDSRELRLKAAKNGGFEEFPVLYEGELLQARAHFGESGGLEGFTLEAEEPWLIEFLPGAEAQTLQARVSRGDAVYFVVLPPAGEGAPGAFETWYDAPGTFLGVLSENPAGVHFDSFGNIQEIETPRGRFSALYNRNGQPRYWDRPAPPPGEAAGTEGPPPYRRFALQWDEGGLLLRLTRFPAPGEGADEEYRYEYTLDERGNWIERRERRMIRQSGFLVPDRLRRISRIIEYPED